MDGYHVQSPLSLVGGREGREGGREGGWVGVVRNAIVSSSRMFWRIVSHMTNTQRQQLLYFATGSAALPASVDSSSRVPSESPPLSGTLTGY